MPEHIDIGDGRQGMMDSFISLNKVTKDVNIIVRVSVELVPVEKFVQNRPRLFQFVFRFDCPERKPAD